MNEEVSHKNEIEYIQIENENFYRIKNVDDVRPFFMSIVSDSNHWMFISSNGGVSAGRKDADHALFPYYTDDKITESVEITGSKSIFLVYTNNKPISWEPFSVRSEERFNISRNLFKNEFGNKIIFEEINHDLSLSFSYEWNSSNIYGFIKKSKLSNLSAKNCKVKMLDGIQNIVPFGVGSDLQNKVSNLTDAYKRSELHVESGVGIFALSAIIVDKAEPSEALKANIVWSQGLENPTYLLSSLQLKSFRKNEPIFQEEDIKGEKGAYLIINEIELNANQHKEWMLVANVNQTQSAIVSLIEKIKNYKALAQKVQDDIDLGTRRLIALAASSDGLQRTADNLRDTRHFSNTLFNIMRGGIFDDNYKIEKWDFFNYLQKANKKTFAANQQILNQLPEKFSVFELKNVNGLYDNADLKRLATEYLPLKFSRRHGDPSRPWNQFAINNQSEVDGSKILDYQGNWRDIFQNWEALAHSFPAFIEGMISKFLNASTFDGYNPYRVTKDGFDWETIEPDNPWSYIGYWGDHQIIYLLKFLEFIENHQPNTLENLLDKNEFVYANVPYRIKSYNEIVNDSKDTITYDHKSDKTIRELVSKIGADGALLMNGEEIYHVSFIEKILATLLSKLSNFVPEAGIWMNTQRPEWNDANNALVGNGVSMVTLYYLRRFLKFIEPVMQKKQTENFTISKELKQFFSALSKTLIENSHLLSSKINDTNRKVIVDRLGTAGSDYRNQIYDHGFCGTKESITSNEIIDFVKTTLQFLEHSILANKRTDKLYHAYNLISFEGDAVKIAHLSEMLEGQVAVLSSGFLSSPESLDVLDALKSSALFRHNQYSYLLYPNKNLPAFLVKNNIPKKSVERSELLQKLIADGNQLIVEKDVKDNYHFNGNFKNADDFKKALRHLDSRYQPLLEKEENLLPEIFEQVFNHKEFTGRSGTFYGYEGLGSIYWHMVSKLLLAVQETCIRAITENSSKEVVGGLLEHYYEINEGIGVHKSPELYGAFPTDPYSHTPLGKGAQQPGMTGQVKEDILSRFGELGVFIQKGKLNFQPVLLHKSEFLNDATTVDFFDINGKQQQVSIDKNSLFFTYVQVPIIYKLSVNEGIEIFYYNNTSKLSNHLYVNEEDTDDILKRNGKISSIQVFLKIEKLR